ncbi:MAG TPA: autotransporter-associated beta strand repeat-containing protein, partial [Verrucomicrobiae bacterium]|nr:autotransporter-associated beta strand repeat-containing protein [Verrucomicrobiae bacterium]
NWSSGIVANGPGVLANFDSLDITANRTVTLDSARTIGGLEFGDISGAQNWILTGGNTLTLDGGGGNAATIAVNENTATISTALAGSTGFIKTGAGTLALNGNNAVGGGLTVDAGAVSVTGGSTTAGTAVTSIGYETGSGALNISNSATFTALGNVWVGGSDQSGTAYDATGTVNIAGGTVKFGGPGGYGGAHYADGGLAIGAGNNYQNNCSGTVNVSGGMVWVTNDLIIGFAGTGTGTLNISGTGVVNVGAGGTRWLSLGKWDTSNGRINIAGGNLNLLNGTSIKFASGNGGNNGGGGTNTITQSGGTVAFYGDGGVTPGGSGLVDLSQSGSATGNNTYNLNGGTLLVPRVTSLSTNGARAFNFNGGTLKATAANTNFFSLGAGNGVANVRNGGAIIDDGGFGITVAQPLLHSAIAGDAATDGGLTKNGAGTLTLTGANTYDGNSLIGAGTLALSGAGSIANSGDIAVGGGASFDVATVSGGFTLGAAQTLSGAGAINGAAMIDGTVAPGSSGTFGTLTFNSPPTMSGTTLMKIDRNNGAPVNDQVRLSSGALTYGGVLTVTNAGAALQPGDAFALFNASGYGGAFAVTNLPSPGSGLAWSNSLAANGTIAVIATVSLDPTNINWSVAGTNLELSWPADHLGWRLQVQTNALNTGMGTNWQDVPGAAATNDLVLPTDPSAGSVFYRLIFP